jgi:hypothetical protein
MLKKYEAFLQYEELNIPFKLCHLSSIIILMIFSMVCKVLNPCVEILVDHLHELVYSTLHA